MAVAATGFFDGVHLGHRQVIDTLVSSARKRGEESIVVTFAQHPRAVLQQDPKKLRLLTSREEKVSMLHSLGVDRVEVIDFSREFATLTAERYLREVLAARFGVDAVVLGYDNRLGSDKLLPADLRAVASRSRMEVIEVPPFAHGDLKISSTKIRSALDRGDVEAASGLLGYDYPISGIVVPGKQLGRTIGFPTANLGIGDPLKQLPGRGVYATRTEVMGRTYRSMTNVGDIVETNIFDFDEDIYSLELHVRFRHKIRDMRKFASLDELRSQLEADRQLIMTMDD